MAFSWNNLGRESPLVRGVPAEFDAASASFARIARETCQLSHDLNGIRLSESDQFKGQAADSLHNMINEIHSALSDVPKIANEISTVFQNHSNRLAELSKRAASALARAQTNWNSKVAADNAVSASERRLNTIDYQLDQLSWQTDPSADNWRSDLMTQRSHALDSLYHNQCDQTRADDRVQDSCQEYDGIRCDEDELNKETSSRLLNVNLWDLKDPGWFEKLGGAIVDSVKAWWNLLGDVAEVLYPVLDMVLTFVDAAGILFELIPGVAQVYKLVEAALVGFKLIVGLILVMQDKMKLSEVLLSTLWDLAAMVVPTIMVKSLKPFLKPLIKQIRKTTPTLNKIFRELDTGFKKQVNTWFKKGEQGASWVEKRMRQYANLTDPVFDKITKMSGSVMTGVASNLKVVSRKFLPSRFTLGGVTDRLANYGRTLGRREPIGKMWQERAANGQYLPKQFSNGRRTLVGPLKPELNTRGAGGVGRYISDSAKEHAPEWPLRILLEFTAPDYGPRSDRSVIVDEQCVCLAYRREQSNTNGKKNSLGDFVRPVVPGTVPVLQPCGSGM